MLDLAGILFSSLMMLLVIVRAVRRDRSQPWFQPIAAKDRPLQPRPRMATARVNRPKRP